ncbi:MAG: diguanylate cyclase [Betaproteobacteria bacterium]
MDFLGPIRGQMEAVKLPLYAVTVTAVPRPDTPVLLMLHWHGFRRDFLVNSPEANPVAFTSVATSALQLNERWREMETLDLAAMEAGWELGAWDVARHKRRACMRPGADSSEALECLRAFGSYPEAMGGRDLVIGDVPDADELLQVGANAGYLTWKFRPVAGGIWVDVADDLTLVPDGSRAPTCPLMPAPAPDNANSTTIYQFGRGASTLLH